MTTIRVDTQLAAAPADVWADIRHIDSHVEWMHDAVEIRFTGDQTSGEGTTFDCDTNVGPIRLTDRMETLHFPWWMGGPVGGVVGGWILTRIWRRNLRDLAARFA